MLASAYELREQQVEDDAVQVQFWVGPDGELLGLLQERHGWTIRDEYAPYYLAALRRALDGRDRANGYRLP